MSNQREQACRHKPPLPAPHLLLLLIFAWTSFLWFRTFNTSRDVMTQAVTSLHTRELITCQYTTRSDLHRLSLWTPLLLHSFLLLRCFQEKSKQLLPHHLLHWVYRCIFLERRDLLPTCFFSTYNDLAVLEELYLVKQNTWMFLIEAESEFDKWIVSSPSSTRLDQSFTSSV